MGPADGAGPPRGSAGEHGGLLAGDAEAPSYGAADEGEGEPTLREPRSRGAAIITAGLLGSVLSVGLLQAAGAHGARGAARAGENTSAAEPLPPSVVLMHEEPHTLPEYLTDPYALCRDFKHATQPVYIGMFQSGLVSLAMTVFAMMPEPVGGGDPYHPGTLGFIFAGWNIFSGLKVTVELLVLSQLPLELPAFQRYEMHCWLAASSPKFQSMMTIFMHKWLCVHWTILNPNPATGEMVGWKRPVTVLMFVASAADAGTLAHRRGDEPRGRGLLQNGICHRCLDHGDCRHSYRSRRRRHDVHRQVLAQAEVRNLYGPRH
eukprot:TRINITY_DN35285_c0_g1_i1.p1 TRINITY_DN35285_c0_g1~~TRINITY_DN35285_c0_g1_i1.p1  ORF type:complete len:356 (+),score=47.90 TRINITY_DN35285_c0_g1_i1:112-1068(+)